MLDIDRRFSDALEPKIVLEFVEKQDREFLKQFIDFLDRQNKLDIGNNKRIYNSDSLEVTTLVKKYSQKVFTEYNTSEPLYTHVMGLIKYVEGDWMEVHWDRMDDECSNCVLSSVMYLNEEYSGGEITFPSLGKEYHPKEGSWVSYPSLDTRFDHGVNRVTSGVRYALAWCFTTDLNKAFKPYLLMDEVK